MARWTSLAALALAAVSAAAEDSTQIPLALGHGSGVVLTDALRAKLSGVLVKHGVPGYALALVRPGGIEFTNWGNATEDGRPMAPDTTITLASVSKAFTATALGLLIDDYAHGRNATPLPPTLRTLSWASKLVDVLPEWGVPDGDIRAHLSLRDALSHVSGLPRHDFVYARGQSAEDLLGMFPHLRAAYELREQWSYNNLFYMLTQVIIERYSGQPFADFVSARIFAPLNMSSTTYSVSEGETAGTATHAFTKAGRRIPTWLTDAEVALNAGAGGVVSSAADLTRWVAHLLGPGSGAVPRGVLDAVLGPQALLRGDGGLPPTPTAGATTYGFGWFQWHYHGHHGVQHGGSVDGVSTALALFPDDGLGLITLCNGDAQYGANQEVMWTIADEVFGIESAARPPPVPVPALNKVRIRGVNLSVDAIAGTYADPAYGSFALCTAASALASCAPVLAAFASIAPLDDHTLYAVWPRLWSDHLRVVPREGLFVPVSLYPAGYGRDKSAFETGTDAGVHVDFGVGEEGAVRGMGVSWDDWPEGKGEEGSVEERAQVWFRRVDEQE